MHPQGHPGPAAALPPPEPSGVLQDLRQSRLLRGQGDARPALLPPLRGSEPVPSRDEEGGMGWGLSRVGGLRPRWWARGCGDGAAVPPQGCPKVRRILEIWGSGQGVISVHCFQSSVPAEAYTRESCVVEALGEWGCGGGTGPGIGSATSPTPLRAEQGAAACPGVRGEFGVPGWQHGVWAQAPHSPSPVGERCLGAGANGDPTGLWVLTGRYEGAEPIRGG